MNTQRLITFLFYTIIGLFILSQFMLITGLTRAYLMNRENNIPFILFDLREEVTKYPSDTVFGFMTPIDDAVEANNYYRRAINSVIPHFVVESSACCQWVIAYSPDLIDTEVYTIVQSFEHDFFILENLAYTEREQ